MTEHTDLVDFARQQLAQVAARTGHRLPPVSQPGRLPAPRRSAATWASAAKADVTVPGVDLPSAPAPRPRRRGRPTSPDGRARRRSASVPSLGQLMGKEIVKNGWQEPLAKGWIMGQWPELVGEQVAANTRVELIKDTTVVISCSTTAWATNLRYLQSEILARIAEEVGDGVVTTLRIYGPKAPSWRHGRLHVKGRGPRDTYG